MTVDWTRSRVATDGTHHVIDGRPLYSARFAEVLKFHAPGLAPVRDESGAYHVDTDGKAVYAWRFVRTFGFYEGLAAVITDRGWVHVRTDGGALSAAIWAWAGNFQEGRCPVRDADGRYAHIGPDGRPVYEERYRYVGDFRDGVAVIQSDTGCSTHIDVTGSFTHGQWFLDLDVFHKGFARARDEFGWTHIDQLGRAAYPRRFAMVEAFYNGQSRVERFDGALEIIDERGTTLAELRPPPRSEAIGGAILARSAWGRVHLVGAQSDAPVVVKWTRGSNDREVEALLALRGVPGVPRLLGRDRFDMNDQLRLEHCVGEVVGQPRLLRVWPESEAIRVTLGVLRICEAMHERGWVHTDIHPGNVLAGEPPTLLDYACAVQATYEAPWHGEINWGVWEYVPPEQLADYGRIDPAADIYSAACLCLAMLTGAPPVRVPVNRHFNEGGWPAVRRAFREAGPLVALSAIREPVRRALASALAEEPSARPTAHVLQELLSRV